jgi:hypothetical protein
MKSRGCQGLSVADGYCSSFVIRRRSIGHENRRSSGSLGASRIKASGNAGPASIYLIGSRDGRSSSLKRADTDPERAIEGEGLPGCHVRFFATPRYSPSPRLLVIDDCSRAPVLLAAGAQSGRLSRAIEIIARTFCRNGPFTLELHFILKRVARAAWRR